MQLLLPLSSEEAVSIHVAHLDPRAVSEGDVPGFLTQEVLEGKTGVGVTGILV